MSVESGKNPHQVRNGEHEEFDQGDDSHRPFEPMKPVSRAYCVYDPFTHPISSIKLLAAIGMTVPPIDDPVAAIPNANDLRFLNHCETMVGTAPKIIPQHDPTRMP